MSDYSNINVREYSDLQLIKMIGVFIKRKRINQEYTQAELAERCGLERASIVRLESGKGATIATFIRVLRMLSELELLEPCTRASELTPIEIYKIEKKILKKRRMRVRHKKNTLDDSD